MTPRILAARYALHSDRSELAETRAAVARQNERVADALRRAALDPRISIEDLRQVALTSADVLRPVRVEIGPTVECLPGGGCPVCNGEDK